MNLLMIYDIFVGYMLRYDPYISLLALECLFYIGCYAMKPMLCKLFGSST